MNPADRLLRQAARSAAILLAFLGTIYTLGISLSYLLNPEQYAEFFGERDPAGIRQSLVLLHICGGFVALILGALQFWTRLQFRHPRWHRAIGWSYVIGVLGGSAGALTIAPFSLGPASNAAGFAALGTLWAGSTLIALWQIRTGRIAAHSRWMAVSYWLTLAAVSLRLQLLVFQLVFALSFEEAYAIVAWSSWLPNLAIALFVVRKRARAEQGARDRCHEGAVRDNAAGGATATDIG